ncbi:DUF1648 domain-containing protein [Chryseomicrobium sp. FSL W7-1435]|uniref:DUF1648 domain-containing protein n=1 Tax=Chryseomicrobium sp. FSL W7-1435 TaxID=2921704 RepID=UPI00315A16A5
MWKQNRPHIELEATNMERLLLVLTVGIYITWIGWLAFQWSSLPAELPAHFGIDGEVNRWGSKWELLILPGISGILGFFMIWLRKKPEWHNYPVNITKENAPFYYRLSRNLLVWITFVIVAGFAWLTWDIVQIAKSNSPFLENWFMPVFLTATFAPVVYFFFKMFRYQSKNNA